MIVSSTLLLFGLVVGANQSLCNGLITPIRSPFGSHSPVAKMPASRPLHVLGTPVSENDNGLLSDIDYEEIFVITFPIITMTAAFLTYDDTARAFHEFVIAGNGGLEFVE